MRLGVAAAAIGAVGGIVWGDLGGLGWMALGGLAFAFVVLVVLHSRVHEAVDRAKAALRFHDRGLARLGLDWTALPVTSDRFRVPDHPFAGDLDVFGRASIMQLIDATETRFGEERLAAMLSAEDPPGGPHGWKEAVQARQAAARELAGRFAFREELAVAGGVLGAERPDPAPLLAWAEGRGEGADRFEPPPPWLGAAAWAVPAVAVVLIAGGAAAGVSWGRVLAALAVLQVIAIAIGLRLTPMLEAVSARESSVTRWRAMLAAVEKERFEAPPLQQLGARLAGASRGAATRELARLETIVGFTDARRNEGFRFFIGPLLMWDAHCTLALERWRARVGPSLRGWLDALAEVEALASLAAFADEHPDYAWPELANEATFQAEKLGHPLIPGDKRVTNDVRLPTTGRALVITGSNMSGKSTLLRAMGLNAVLASAGAPVCAAALRVGPLRVATSMRIEDSLEHGVSHFYAELRRLKRILDLARAGLEERAPVLFLLDEILHGTNSRERIIGACAVVRELVSLGALGAVSTHDLGITALEEELPEHVENAHFEEQVQGDAMSFDYTLRPGIVHSSNALRLMRAVGIDVVDTPP